MRLQIKRLSMTCLVGLLLICSTLMLYSADVRRESTMPEVNFFRRPPIDAYNPRFVNGRNVTQNETFNLQVIWGNKLNYDHEIFPVKHKPWFDRIVNQMNYIPRSYDEGAELVTIYMPEGLAGNPEGQGKFLRDNCPVNRCWITQKSAYRKSANAVIYQNSYFNKPPNKPPHQIWIIWMLESPINSADLYFLNDRINWTATYRSDSTIVTPYEKFVHFDNFTALPSKPERNYASGKTKMAAWFVSNCNSANKRMEYVLKLKEYIDVDIYGGCGKLHCSRYDNNKCNDLLNKQYKFYLSFENSNCKYYITEKFYWNALFNDIVPVVMGGRKEDYAAVSPPGSFIHVEDFPNPKALAEYLIKIDKDDELYNSYFRWKGTGHFVDTKFWCRLCAMLHGVQESSSVRWYRNVERWWRHKNVCTRDRWDNTDDFFNGEDFEDMGFRNS